MEIVEQARWGWAQQRDFNDCWTGLSGEQDSIQSTIMTLPPNHSDPAGTNSD